MQIGFPSEYANLSVCGEISCYREFLNEEKDETDCMSKERFGRKALFKTFVDFLSEPKNVWISYEYETHEVEFIMLRSMFTWLHGKNIAQRYVENTESSTF